MPVWLLITISIAFIGLLGYAFGVKREKSLPDESEVIGKDLPVGSLFLKDGKVVEVVRSKYCVGCLYDSGVNCDYLNMPICFGYKRKKGDPVIFKYVDHE